MLVIVCLIALICVGGMFLISGQIIRDWHFIQQNPNATTKELEYATGLKDVRGLHTPSKFCSVVGLCVSAYVTFVVEEAHALQIWIIAFGTICAVVAAVETKVGPDRIDKMHAKLLEDKRGQVKAREQLLKSPRLQQ